jgi:hypothetical protein
MVQKRRLLPTRLIQAAQVFIQKRVLVGHSRTLERQRSHGC